MNANLSIGIESLGWTLVHFIWQGAAIAAVAAIVLRAQRGASPNARYLFACGALGLMVASAAATFAWQWNTTNAFDVFTANTRDLSASMTSGGAPAIEFDARYEAPFRFSMLPGNIRAWLPSIVTLWSIGVSLLSLRLAFHWNSLRRLRSTCRELREPQWNESFERLKRLLRVPDSVQLWQSTAAAVPMAFGWVKPVVLIPAALITGLTGPQLEAILAHELAHIRRHDYLVNLLQNAIEVMLFYHPAVWWISRRIRAEREFCCDDIAAAAAGGTLTYGRALAVLEQLRPREIALTMAAAGGSLVQRIRRLVGVQSDSPRITTWPALSGALAAALIASLIATGRPGVAEAQSGDAKSESIKTQSAAVETKIGDEPKQYGIVLKMQSVKPSVAETLIKALLVDADGNPLSHAPAVTANDEAMTFSIGDGSWAQTRAITALLKQIDNVPSNAANDSNPADKLAKVEAVAKAMQPTGPVTVRLSDTGVVIVGGLQDDVTRIVEFIQDLEGRKPSVKKKDTEERLDVLPDWKASTAPDETEKLGLFDRAERENERSFSVVQLKRMPADAVLKTIQGTMKVAAKPEDDGLYVSVDSPNNRLLLRANNAEYSKVIKVLRELGEVANVAMDHKLPRSAAPAVRTATATATTTAKNELDGDKPVIEVVLVQNNDPDTVLILIKNKFPEVNDESISDSPRVDKAANGPMIVIRAKRAEARRIQQFIGSLESPRILKKIQLKKSQAADAATAIRQSLKDRINPEDSNSFLVLADAEKNTLVIRAHREEQDLVWKILRELGEDSAEPRGASTIPR